MSIKMPNLESVIVTVFILSVALWAVSKCAESRAKLIKNQERMQKEESSTSAHLPVKTNGTLSPSMKPIPSSPPKEALDSSSPVTTYSLPKPAPLKRPMLTKEPQPPALTPSEPPTATYSTLYVTIDGLNLRKEPNRRSAIIGRLKLYEPVLFLNKKSEQLEEINLGREKVKDYWIFIRTQSGKEGWVFGAGLHYYPMKRPGTE
ncbi:MAG: SH3 domain-containing protein [Saprospiraceae bacterium]|nr:SH3 domain-containing protein [Saprospiraceae bacterium]MDW8483298.1 SH3 domain-containing protein [Saprospiraceae bacterium]